VDSLYNTYCRQVISNVDYQILEVFKYAGISNPDPIVMHKVSFTYAFSRLTIVKYLFS